MKGLLLISGLCFPLLLFASNDLPLTRIVIQPIETSAGDNATYYPRVLELALTKTVDTHGSFTISYYPLRLTRNRLIHELERDNVINVIWAMTSSQRETMLHPIKISLMKDLNNYRVFLIRKSDQKRFNKIKTLDDLRLFRAGQGTTWPDTKILKSNQLPVITAMHYQLLFDMLAANRFDYFPRGLNEIWDEEKIHADKDFAIEQNLMLHYHRPLYFFTNKKNIALANRIEQGLKIAIEDGSFDELFYSYESFRRGETELTANKRIIFDLKDDFNFN